MKKYLLALLLLTSVFAVAAGVDVVQFTDSDFNTYHTEQTLDRPQFWDSAQMITLNVPANSTVYLSYYVSNWYDVPDLASPVNPEGFNMDEGKYGYVLAEHVGDSVRPVADSFQPGDGTTKELTIQNPTNKGPKSVTTTGYLLDTFDKETEIFLVMTPHGFTGPVNSYDFINDPDMGITSELVSRQINLVDAAGATRFDFAGSNGSHVFTVGYVASAEPPQPPPSGQPLPGVLTSCLIALGATGIAARRRKHSRK